MSEKQRNFEIFSLFSTYFHRKCYYLAMSTIAQQLQQELQNELTISNQLLHLISLELQQIKQYTSPNGEFEENIKKNASLVKTLAKMQQIDIENVPPMTRTHIDMSNHSNQNQSYEQHETFRDTSNMNDSQ